MLLLASLMVVTLSVAAQQESGGAKKPSEEAEEFRTHRQPGPADDCDARYPHASGLLPI